MNSRQKLAAFLALLFAVAIVLLPPWVYIYHPYKLHVERPAGYHVLWSSNQPTDKQQLMEIFSLDEDHTSLDLFSVKLDWSRLDLEIVGLIIITAISQLLLRTERARIDNQ